MVLQDLIKDQLYFLNDQHSQLDQIEKNLEFFLCFCGCQLYCLEGDGRHLRLAGDWLELNLAEDSWELANLLDEGLTARARFSRERDTMDGWETQENSTDFCLMESGLERQVLTICLEMHILVDCFSTMWVIPTGLFRREI